MSCEENINVETTPAIHEESVEVIIPELTRDEYNVNGWEEDLEECIHGDGVDIQGWQEFCQQIKDLKKGGNSLPLTKINQLLVLKNFTTLQLKGYGKIKASIEIAQQWHQGKGKHYPQKI